VAWHRSIGPAEIVRCLSSTLGAASLGYDAFWAFLLDEAPDALRLIGGLALISLGWLPFLVRGTRGRLVATVAAALASLVLSRLWFGMPMHDISIEIGWLDHDRWCAPADGRIITASTAPLILFAPLILWASWQLVGARSGPADSVNRSKGAP